MQKSLPSFLAGGRGFLFNFGNRQNIVMIRDVLGRLFVAVRVVRVKYALGIEALSKGCCSSVFIV